MSVMDMRLPGGVYHLVKEARCGKHYEVSYSKCRAVNASLLMNGTDSSSDELTLVSRAAAGPLRKY